jgi:predicted transcriptional regulator
VTEEKRIGLVSLTADIAAAYVSNNRIDASQLPALIQSVQAALVSAEEPPPPPVAAAPTPAVSIKKSVNPDYIICLEDGRRFKSLKRHLMTKFSLTPDEYRAKWGLPKDYPMAAPSYAAARSSLAKKIGLGQKPAPKAAAPAKRSAKGARAGK